MFHPITPQEPLLSYQPGEDIDYVDEVTSLYESSPSLASLEGDLSCYDDALSYYQPPECGMTSRLTSDSGVIKETGV